jgi:hypothetical protein
MDSVLKAGVPRYFDVPRDSSYHRVSQTGVGTAILKRVAEDTGLTNISYTKFS